ncbi:hypothetical protein ACFJGW_17470 [Burkholderiaceae bacterium UC74_6]
MQTDASIVKTEKFCPECGRSRLPLDVPHLSADCGDCGRTVHFVRRGEGGEGLNVNVGERLTIPHGWINFSLEPKPNGKLFRHGLSFLLNQFFLAKVPSEDTYLEFVAELEREFDAHTDASEPAQGLDFSSDEGKAAFAERMEKLRFTHDWYSCMASVMAGAVLKYAKEGDVTKAALLSYQLGTFRGLTIVSEPLFEETLWRGYLANEVVFEAAAAAGNRNPAELEALKKLSPLFKQMDEVTLTALVESGLPLGPKINVSKIPEELLRALAKHELATRERERQEAKQVERDVREEARLALKDKRDDRELRFKWAHAGMVLMGALIGTAGTLWMHSGDKQKEATTAQKVTSVGEVRGGNEESTKNRSR